MRTTVLLRLNRLPCPGNSWRMTLCVDAMENIYFTDYSDFKIKVADAKGNVRNLAGSGKRKNCNGPADEADFDTCKALAVSDDGVVYVAQAIGVRKIHDGQVSCAISRYKKRYAILTEPSDMCIDETGSSVLLTDYIRGMLIKIGADGLACTDHKGYTRSRCYFSALCVGDGKIFIVDYCVGVIHAISTAGTSEIKNFGGNTVTSIAAHAGVLYVATRPGTGRIKSPESIICVLVDDAGEYQRKVLVTDWVFSDIQCIKAKNGFIYVMDVDHMCVTRTNLYAMWNPTNHKHMSLLFKRIVRTVLLMRARPGTVWARVPRDIVLLVFEWLYLTY